MRRDVLSESSAQKEQKRHPVQKAAVGKREYMSGMYSLQYAPWPA